MQICATVTTYLVIMLQFDFEASKNNVNWFYSGILVETCLSLSLLWNTLLVYFIITDCLRFVDDFFERTEVAPSYYRPTCFCYDQMPIKTQETGYPNNWSSHSVNLQQYSVFLLKKLRSKRLLWIYCLICFNFIIHCSNLTRILLRN